VGPQGVQGNVGPIGPVGPTGPQGAPGPAFYTTTTAAAVTPSTSNQVQIAVNTTTALVAGVVLYIHLVAKVGYYTCLSVDSPTLCTITDPGVPTNPPAGTTIPNNAVIVGVGPVGPVGATGPVGPAGPIGPVGQAFTHTNANFNIPPVGGNLAIGVNDATWLTPGMFIFING